MVQYHDRNFLSAILTDPDRYYYGQGAAQEKLKVGYLMYLIANDIHDIRIRNSCSKG